MTGLRVDCELEGCTGCKESRWCFAETLNMYISADHKETLLHVRNSIMVMTIHYILSAFQIHINNKL